MAELVTNDQGGRKAYSKRRAKRNSTHIDMTPMVDLMSLLITFFMLTTAFAKPKIMEIILPEDGGIDDSQVKYAESRTLNLLLAENNKAYYYVGKPPVNDNDVIQSSGRIKQVDYGKDGIRKILLKMNMFLYEKVDSARNDLITGKTNISQDSLKNIIKAYKRKDKKGPLVLIKAGKKAKYKNIVDVIDEMAICNVARYAIVDLNEYEQKLLDNAPH